MTWAATNEPSPVPSMHASNQPCLRPSPVILRDHLFVLERRCPLSACISTKFHCANSSFIGFVYTISHLSSRALVILPMQQAALRGYSEMEIVSST